MRDKSDVSVDSLENSTDELTVVQFVAAVGTKKRPLSAAIMFQCERDSASGFRGSTPLERTESENSGGRYYRHVAWVRNFDGRGWSGELVYIDYVFGDGRKSRNTAFFMCRKPNHRVCVSIDVIGRDRLLETDITKVLAIYNQLIMLTHP